MYMHAYTVSLVYNCLLHSYSLPKIDLKFVKFLQVLKNDRIIELLRTLQI